MEFELIEEFVDDPSSNRSDLIVEKKESAIWDDQAILALLGLYEANMNLLDHPKKKVKLWEIISQDLNKSFGIEMSKDQIRWKWNSLLKKYKECVDNNLKSGRSLMTFKWYNQMDDILHQGSVTSNTSNHIFSSTFKSTLITPTSPKPSTSSAQDDNLNTSLLLTECKKKSSENLSTNLGKSKSNKNRNIAQNKIALEKHLTEYMENKVEWEKAKEEKQTLLFEQTKELLKLKRRRNCLKEEEIKQKRLYCAEKLKGKENRHIAILNVENKKLKLLKKVFKVALSDSD
ncbi:uncharacterized protein [Prorops nasuta]|uniref:uncharacterized protein n=1 Tax=Prorops nasuta TaxID=863751 RepID=UPI0034CEDA8B